MKNFNFLFSLLLLLFALESFAQEKKPARFHVALDYRYNLGLRERSDLWTLKRDTNKMGGNSIHLTFLYHVTSRITAGAGFGLDGYTSPSHNSHFCFWNRTLSSSKKVFEFLSLHEFRLFIHYNAVLSYVRLALGCRNRIH